MISRYESGKKKKKKLIKLFLIYAKRSNGLTINKDSHISC